MEFKYKIKTRKDMEKELKKNRLTRKGGEPLIDDIYNKTKNNTVSYKKF